jgi:hypothetical protein
MLSKIIRPFNKAAFLMQRRAFGTNPGMFGKVFGAIESVTHSKGYGVARSDPCVPLKGLKYNEVADIPSVYNVTNLNNGFTVLTESSSFPGAVHLGFMMDVGTRDET